MSMLRTISFVALAGLCTPVIMAAPAEARIRCDGPYQLSGGDHIRTPYCEDNYLAQVAHGYGMAVASAEIRHNFNAKRRVCELVGHDNRVADICTGLRPQDRGKILVP